MYSYEDRLRAVRLYIKLGKRVSLTLRQLGDPTKNALEPYGGDVGHQGGHAGWLRLGVPRGTTATPTSPSRRS